MAKFEFELAVEPRDVQGKGASRRLRRENNKVPAIVYGGGENPRNIMIDHFDVMKALSHDAIFSHILTLKAADHKQRVVLKDVQRHPYKPRVLHMDFLRINENTPITMHVPIHFIGENDGPGVKLEGGTVTHHMVEVEIKCLPRDLPEFIAIDLSDAPIDTVVHLSQLNIPKGVELTSVVHGAEDDLPVVSIHKPKRVDLEEEGAAEIPSPDVPATAQSASDENADKGKDKK